MPHRHNATVFIFTLMLVCRSPLATATSDTDLCTASKHSSGWLMLNSQCDIGRGLWGTEPTTSEGHFWVQCNYSQTIPTKSFTGNVLKHFPKQSFLAHHEERYRCLIGPLASFEHAKITQRSLGNIGIKQTFIRHVTVDAPLQSQDAPPRPEPNDNAQAIAATHQPEIQPQTLIKNRTVLNSVIYSFTFEGLNYYQPRNIQSLQTLPPAFVHENEQYWSRVNITDADQWCARYGLRLPSFEELSQLQTYGQRFLLRKHWPIEMNYWSDTVSNYSGEIRTLNLRSGRADEYRPLALLYTTCVNNAT